MGVPKLRSHLEPYASPVQFISGQTSENSYSRRVIVDGPGLAYFIYHQLRSSKSRSENRSEAAPSYQELGTAVILWLESLQSFDLEIAHIFFDGFLPESKKPTRISRLEDYRSKLVKIKTLNSDRSAYSLMNPVQLSDLLLRKSNDLPAPPFLVPAVIECLSNSSFSAVTEVVSGEADNFCAATVFQDGGIILTSDSDLLVYDLRGRGSVIFFDDLTSTNHSTASILKGVAYQTSSIASRLGLKRLLPLAFTLSEDPGKSFVSLINASRSVDEAEASFSNFEQNYLIDIPNGLQPDIEPLLKRLDPRISEYILQILPHTRSPPHKADAHVSFAEYDIYLPFLIEDPDKAAAWAMGTPIRHLLYSLTPNPASRVHEHFRKGQRISRTEYVPFTLEETVSSCSALSETIATTLGDFKDYATPVAWRALGLLEVLRSLLEENKSLPPVCDIEAVLSGRAVGVGWSVLHLYARVQAYLYSLRMLRQSVDVFITAQNSLDERLISALKPLQTQLGDMPELATLFPELTRKSGEGECGVRVSKMFEALGLQEPSEQGFTGHKGKKKKGRKGLKKEGEVESTPSPSSTNMYNLLSLDKS
ncbi:hypothetical protein M501DRAFT_1012557 [Patellaria atrata CBS 101060]|uniref:Asteroid domain-containing protein n=1 Tax=Patellaria atrata CBS 101060 TaxID=1346257 RepID=A0A9P4SHT2_9PEZI|nr:hypothetical protein M501DRAFT_1012557 [Patellaria atrata CBS 101060]